MNMGGAQIPAPMDTGGAQIPAPVDTGGAQISAPVNTRGWCGSLSVTQGLAKLAA